MKWRLECSSSGAHVHLSRADAPQVDSFPQSVVVVDGGAEISIRHDQIVELL